MPAEKNPAAVTLGRMGGATKTPAKSEAARRNGKLGGRPRKVVTPAPSAASPVPSR
jgi:hypothetical protein